jgi:hypothetical protein
MDPRTGLAELSGYKATLTFTFDGTGDGKAQKWSKIYTMVVTKDPAARQLSIKNTGDMPDLDPVFLAEMDGVDYERHGQNACNASVIQEGDSLGDRLEPALFLPSVIGADEAGTATVNKQAAAHYTFDQRALDEEGLTEASGELWVAAQGDFVVKFLLTRKAKADYFGDGLEGTLTLDYELTDVNQKVTITLPDDCPPGLVQAPQLQDASNVSSTPGLLTYETSSSPEDASTFYQKALKDLGWEAAEDPVVSDSTTLLNFTRGDQAMSIILVAKDGKTTVTISLGSIQQ